jgi:hypothetical protein
MLKFNSHHINVAANAWSTKYRQLHACRHRLGVIYETNQLRPCLDPKNFAKSPKPKMGQQPTKKVQATGLVFWRLDAKNFAKHGAHLRFGPQH